jgi:hypothetical protein
MQGTARSCNETLNRHLKNWGILEKVYRHDIMVHGTSFYACAVITQLAIASGEPLFQVEYGDETRLIISNFIVTILTLHLFHYFV